MTNSTRKRVASTLLAFLTALGGVIGIITMLLLVLVLFGDFDRILREGSGGTFREHLLQGSIAVVLGAIGGGVIGTRFWMWLVRQMGLLTQTEIDRLWNDTDT